MAACYAKNDPNWNCKEWAAHTPNIKKLPEKKSNHMFNINIKAAQFGKLVGYYSAIKQAQAENKPAIGINAAAGKDIPLNYPMGKPNKLDNSNRQIKLPPVVLPKEGPYPGSGYIPKDYTNFSKGVYPTVPAYNKPVIELYEDLARQQSTGARGKNNDFGQVPPVISKPQPGGNQILNNIFGPLKSKLGY